MRYKNGEKTSKEQGSFKPLEKFSVKRPYPKNICTEDISIFCDDIENEFDPQPWSKYRNVLMTVSGFAVSKNNLGIWWNRLYRPKPKSLKGHIEKLYKFFAGVRELFLAKDKREFNGAVFCCNKWSSGFFHWMCDVLCRLVYLDESGSKYKIVIPKYIGDKEFVRQTFKIFDNLDFYILAERDILYIHKLLHAKPLVRCCGYEENYINKVRNRMRRCFASGQTILSPAKRIYISREKAGARKIVNEDAVWSYLKMRGFQKVIAEDKPAAEQFRLMSKAQVLISNHGSGLAHMLMMDRGSHVIEIRKRGRTVPNCYFTLASALGINYWYILDKPAGVNKNNSDIIVDVNRIRSLLDSIDDETETKSIS